MSEPKTYENGVSDERWIDDIQDAIGVHVKAGRNDAGHALLRLLLDQQSKWHRERYDRPPFCDTCQARVRHPGEVAAGLHACKHAVLTEAA